MSGESEGCTLRIQKERPRAAEGERATWSTKDASLQAANSTRRMANTHYHLTLLCESQRGYANLCLLLTHAHTSGKRGEPEIDFETLARHSEGLIALSGCKKGEVPSLVAAGTLSRGGRGGATLRRRLRQGELLDRAAKQPRLRRPRAQPGAGGAGEATRRGLRRHQQRPLPPARAAPAPGRDGRHPQPHDARRLAPAATRELGVLPEVAGEMAALFAEWPEALANSVRIAERCTFDLTRDLGYHFPDYPVPEGETVDSHLERICYEAARERYGRITPEVDARLREELGWCASAASPASSSSTDNCWRWRARRRRRCAARRRGRWPGCRRDADAGRR